MKGKLCPVVVTAPARETWQNPCRVGGHPFLVVHTEAQSRFRATLWPGTFAQYKKKIIFPFFVPQLVVKHAPASLAKGGWEGGGNFCDSHFRFLRRGKMHCYFCRSAACRRPYVLLRNVVLFANFTLLTNTYANTNTHTGRLVHTVVSLSRIEVNFYSLSWPGATHVTGFPLSPLTPIEPSPFADVRRASSSVSCNFWPQTCVTSLVCVFVCSKYCNMWKGCQMSSLQM